jgi:hypothetical protein
MHASSHASRCYSLYPSSFAGEKSKSSQRIPGWTVAAATGKAIRNTSAALKEDTPQEVAKWRALGTSEAVQEVICGAAITGVLEKVLGPHTNHQDCVHMRAVGTSESTPLHTDYFFCHQQRDILRAPVGIPDAGSAGFCFVCEQPADSDDRLASDTAAPQLQTCTACKRSCHPSCAETVPQTLDTDSEFAVPRWHCKSCANSPFAAYTAWVALTDITEQQGRLALAHGSHKLGSYHEAEVLKRGTVPAGFDAKKASWALPSTISAGSILIFNIKISHGTTDHTGDAFRLSIDTRVTTNK